MSNGATAHLPRVSKITVKVTLNDGSYNEMAFEGWATIKADWMKEFEPAKAISDAVCDAFLKAVKGCEDVQAYKEYDASFQCGICGLGPTVAVKKHFHVCDGCRHGIELHGLEEWRDVIDREGGER